MILLTRIADAELPRGIFGIFKDAGGVSAACRVFDIPTNHTAAETHDPEICQMLHAAAAFMYGVALRETCEDQELDALKQYADSLIILECLEPFAWFMEKEDAFRYAEALTAETGKDYIADTITPRHPERVYAVLHDLQKGPRTA